MIIKSARLLARPFKETDITENYIGWLNDPVVMRFSNQRFNRHTATSSSAYLKEFDGSLNSFLLIERRSDIIPIGTATVYRNCHHGTADIGLMIGDRRCWGQGYGQESWRVILNSVLSECGIRKVTGGTARPNRAMVKIMEQSGMALEAIRERQEIIDGQEVDILYYSQFA
jgi:ribosomal-protein-alanine N-acetyltransferase